MPELAEVEIMGQNLHRWAKGLKVVDVKILRPQTIKTTASLQHLDGLLGVGGLEVYRWGKVLLVRASGRPTGALVRFGMTGKVVREAPGRLREGARLRLMLQGDNNQPAGSIAYLDPRNLGGWTPLVLHAPPLEILKEVVGGRDAWLEPPTGAELARWGSRTRRAVKVFLMAQRPIAGIGNILATEILFKAGVFPGQPARSLTQRQWGAIASAIPLTIGWVLEQEGGDEIHLVSEAGATNPFSVYGRAAQPCPRCSTSLERVVLGGRGSVFCPACQPPMISKGL